MKKNKKMGLWLGSLATGMIAVFLIFFVSSRETQFSKTDHSFNQLNNALASDENKTGETEIRVIEIPMDKQQLIGVKTDSAKVMSFEKILRTTGKIEYDEKKLSTINTKTGGWIEKLYVDYTGKYIQKGEPIAEIYSPELVSTQQELIQISRWLKESKTLPVTNDNQNILDSIRARLKYWDISEKQIKEIEDTGIPIRTLTLYSPVNGYVIEKKAVNGMQVSLGEKLFDIVNLSTVWVTADVYENEISLIRIGQKAVLRSSYEPSEEYRSKVSYIYPFLSGESRTGKIRFNLHNKGLKLKPQMFMNVELKIDLGKRLLILKDAVIDTGTRQILYVDLGKGYFEQRTVKTGLRGEEYLEILEGLSPGEKVAVSANFLIDSEAQLKGTKVRHQHSKGR